MPRKEEPDQFLELAFGYYVSGRFAVLNGLLMGPNLLHHAVELLIKFTLMVELPPYEDPDVAIRSLKTHNLGRLWVRYREGRSADLSRFDSVVAELDRWERLRYGGYPAGISVVRSIGLRRAPELEEFAEGTWDRYQAALQEVDDLIASMYRASDLDPTDVDRQRLGRPALFEWYRNENEHLIPGLFE